MNTRKQVEELAKKAGVVLASPPPVSPAAVPVSKGWLAKVMPTAAQMMVEVREQLGPKIYAEAMENLKAGKGYVVDHGTNIALGSPPREEYELGRAQEQGGFIVRRVVPRK